TACRTGAGSSRCKPQTHRTALRHAMPTTQIYKELVFEAAYRLPSAPAGHPNARIHGHSFHVRVTVAGEPDAEQGHLLPRGFRESYFGGKRPARPSLPKRDRGVGSANARANC